MLIESIVLLDAYAFSYTNSGLKASYNMGKLGVLKAEVFEDYGELTRYEVLKTIMLVICGNDNRDYGDISVTHGLYQDFKRKLQL